MSSPRTGILSLIRINSGQLGYVKLTNLNWTPLQHSEVIGAYIWTIRLAQPAVNLTQLAGLAQMAVDLGQLAVNLAQLAVNLAQLAVGLAQPAVWLAQLAVGLSK